MCLPNIIILILEEESQQREISPLNGLANRMSDRGWSGARALDGYLRFKNCRFETFISKTLMQIRTWQMGY